MAIPLSLECPFSAHVNVLVYIGVMQLRGCVGVHNIISWTPVIPLNIFVIFHKIHLKACRIDIASPFYLDNDWNDQFSWNMYWFKGITRTQHHKAYAFTCISIVHLGPPHIPLSGCMGCVGRGPWITARILMPTQNSSLHSNTSI